MKTINWYTFIGFGFIALVILLKVFNQQHNASVFIQGFCTGLGLVLIVKGFLVRRKEKKE